MTAPDASGLPSSRRSDAKHEEAPADEACMDPLAAEGNTESVDEGTDPAQENDPETFPREYVVKLRDECAKHRQRAADRDDLPRRLHTSLVAATGRLADPSDLTFDDDHLIDFDALAAALDDLLTRKPHLASRRVVGDVGQGVGKGDTTVDLAGMLRRNARWRRLLRPRRHATTRTGYTSGTTPNGVAPRLTGHDMQWRTT